MEYVANAKKRLVEARRSKGEDSIEYRLLSSAYQRLTELEIARETYLGALSGLQTRVEEARDQGAKVERLQAWRAGNLLPGYTAEVERAGRDLNEAFALAALAYKAATDEDLDR